MTERKPVEAEMQQPAKDSRVIMPMKCSDDVARFLSRLGYGFNPGERADDGRKEYDRLRNMMLIEQAKRPTGRTKDVTPKETNHA